MDLTSVIGQSLANAGLTDTDDAGDGTMDPETPPEETGAVEATADPAPTTDTDAPPAATGDPAPTADAAASGADAAPAAPVPGVPKKKQGPIPFERHEKVLQNERTKHATEKTALETRLKNLEWAETPEARARIGALGAADTHPELFAKALLDDAKLGPIFRGLLKVDAPPAATPAAVVPSDRPKPNVVDKDGNPGYDEAGLEALLTWTAAQGAAQAKKAFEEQYGKELAPLVKQHKSQEAWNKDVARADRDLAVARTWDGFTEAEPEIKAFIIKAMQENRPASLIDAYRTVVMGKLKTDRAKLREEILAEMNGKAKVAQPRPAAATAAPVNGGKKDLRDVIAASIAGLE